VPAEFAGGSWARALAGGPPPDREVLCYQTHRGAVHGGHEVDRKRSKGLMAVAITAGDRKEILRMRVNERELFDLSADPGELDSLVPLGSQPSDELLHCVGEILDGLEAADKLPANLLDRENVEMLRQLGYLE
jgi:hypothetical protein